MDVDSLQPGDLFILPDDEQGHWDSIFEYMHPCDDDADRILGRALDGSGNYAVRKDHIVLPSVVGRLTEPGDNAGSGASADEAEPGRRGDLPINDGQRKMIFGLGKKLGLDIDDLRAMTPAGSISALTRAQAAKLIDTLTGRPGSHDLARGAQGTASGKQIGLIVHLRDQIGLRATGLIAGCVGSSGLRRWTTSSMGGWRRA